MAKNKAQVRNIQIKKTPRLYRMRVKMVEKIKENEKKRNRRKWNKQNLLKKLED
jgi:hypothetical protein